MNDNPKYNNSNRESNVKVRFGNTINNKDSLNTTEQKD